MKKSIFRKLMDIMCKRNKHISKSKAFGKIIDNPAGTKMFNRSKPDSRRGCDGTLRR